MECWTKENEKRLDILIDRSQRGPVLSDVEITEKTELTKKKNKCPPPPKKTCFEAAITNQGKYICPLCGFPEGGRQRIITHRADCPNNRIEYCQKLLSGGKRRSRSRKSKKSRKGTYRKRR